MDAGSTRAGGYRLRVAERTVLRGASWSMMRSTALTRPNLRGGCDSHLA
jgi:hypothetical protein